MEVASMANYIQRIMGMVMLAIFMLSIVPLALADTDISVDTDVSVDTSSSTTSTDTSVESDVEVEAEDETQRDGRGRMKERMREVRSQEREHRDEVRGKIIEVRQEMREIHKDRWEHYEEVRADLRAHHNEMLKIRAELKSCAGESCDTKKTELKHEVVHHVDKTLDHIDASFDHLRQRINASASLTAEEKDAALEAIAELEVKVDAEKAKLAELDQNATKEEVKESIKDVKELVKDVRKEQRRSIALLVSAKLDHIVDRHEALSTSMQTRIDGVTAAGADASTLIAIKANFDANTEVLEADVKAAHDLWVEAAADKGKMEAWKAAHEKVRADLKVSKELLREFVAEFREVRSHTTVEAESSTDVETTTQDTTVDSTANATVA